MPSPFAEHHVCLDPWQAEYGPGITVEASADLSAEVDLDVELPADAWAPVPPTKTTRPEHVVVIDGVRRVDARVVIPGAKLTYGAFGSYGVGAVVLQPGGASYGPLETHRVFVLGNGHTVPGPLTASPALTYRVATVLGADFDAPAQYIHSEMRHAEERLSRRLATETDALVIADGPLSFETPIKGPVLGYIKRLMELYLPPTYLPLLYDLPQAHRTPLFAIVGSRRFDRYAWFLRIAPPGPGEVPLTGVVRLECAGELGLDMAKDLADASAALLPALVPSRARDPRSPQNLMPIGALETRLRHLLGDLTLVRRHLTTFVAGAHHA